MQYLAFNKDWFKKNQKLIIILLNHWATKKIFRYLLKIKDSDFIIEITPNSYSTFLGFNGSEVSLRSDFRTHWKYSKRMYFAFKPLWWTLHFWDWLFADRFVPKLSFGFTTLTVYPNADPETTTVDGHVGYSGSGETYATVRNALTGTSAVDNTSILDILSSFNGADYTIRRGFFLFDTSSLGSSATINSAILSLASSTGDNLDANTVSINIYTSSPASNTALATADYDQVGSTAQCDTAKTIASLSSGYNDFTLNATGISNISKTGVSKFGGRIVERDVTSTAPTGANYAAIFAAEQAGTGSDPKLVVDYSIAVTGGVHPTLLTLGVG